MLCYVQYHVYIAYLITFIPSKCDQSIRVNPENLRCVCVCEPTMWRGGVYLWRRSPLCPHRSQSLSYGSRRLRTKRFRTLDARIIGHSTRVHRCSRVGHPPEVRSPAHSGGQLGGVSPGGRGCHEVLSDLRVLRVARENRGLGKVERAGVDPE